MAQDDEIIEQIFDQAQEAVFLAIGERRNLNYGAKTLIVVSSLPSHRVGTDYVNSGIVIENMVLAATDLGIDSCIMGAPIAALAENAELLISVEIPEGYAAPIIGAVFGYATEDEQAHEHNITFNRV